MPGNEPTVPSARAWEKLARQYNDSSRQYSNKKRLRGSGVARHEGGWRSSKQTIVQVWIGSGSPETGDLVQANSDGVVAGRVLKYQNTPSLAIGADCWIAFLGYINDAVDDAIGEHGRILLGMHVGKVTSGGTTKPLYLCELGDQEFLAKRGSATSKGTSAVSWDLYHRDPAVDSTINQDAIPLGHAIGANKWAIVARLRNGQWYASLYET